MIAVTILRKVEKEILKIEIKTGCKLFVHFFFANQNLQPLTN